MRNLALTGLLKMNKRQCRLSIIYFLIESTLAGYVLYCMVTLNSAEVNFTNYYALPYFTANFTVN
jgi:hypothetical protein